MTPLSKIIIRRNFKVKRNAQPETFYSRLLIGYREEISRNSPEDINIHLVFEASDNQPYAVFHVGDSTAIVAPHSKYRTVDITRRTGAMETIECAKSQLEKLARMPLEEAPAMLSQEIIRKEIARYNRYKKSRK